MSYNFDNFLDLLTQYVLNIGLQLLILFNNIKTHMELSYHKLYIDNDLFHRCIDQFHDSLYHVKQSSMSHLIEPPFSYFKICYKDINYKEEYVNADSLIYGTKTTEVLSTLITKYKSIFYLIEPIIQKNELEYLVLLHYRNLTHDYILSRLIHKDLPNAEAIDIIPVRNCFLSIEYSHLNMKTTISLNLDKRFLIAGNELFSPCFVLKCLNYQNEPYIFDNDYKLTILDTDIKDMVLTSDQYIRLTDTKYEVVKLIS